MSRLLQDYHSFQPCSDGGALCRLFNSVVPANRRKGQTHSRVFMQKKAPPMIHTAAWICVLSQKDLSVQ